MNKLYILILTLLIMLPLHAAVGCDLNDPNRDVKRLFPASTGFKTYYRSITKDGGKDLLEKIEKRLGDKFTGLFETIDVPYTLYEIYRDNRIIGYIHGVNQKGRYGGLQLFLAFDTGGTILSMYIQRISGKNSRRFRDGAFTDQFNGLNLRDFDSWNIKTRSGTGKLAGIKNPAPTDEDFYNIMRGLKKNLVLMNHFGYWNPR